MGRGKSSGGFGREGSLNTSARHSRKSAANTTRPWKNRSLDPPRVVLLLSGTTTARLKDKLRCQLHVASFEVATRKHAALGWNEAWGWVPVGISKSADVERAGNDEQIRMIENIKSFQAKLHTVSLAKLDPLVQTEIRVPVTGTAERISF